MASRKHKRESRKSMVKISRRLVASVAVGIAAKACSPDVEQTSPDCASLLAQYDQGIHAAAADNVNESAAIREKGEQLCLKGKTEDGAAKLNEAILQMSGGSTDEPPSRR
jgi:hypothetical protein